MVSNHRVRTGTVYSAETKSRCSLPLDDFSHHIRFGLQAEGENRRVQPRQQPARLIIGVQHCKASRLSIERSRSFDRR
jgi:hypothetical protein